MRIYKYWAVERQTFEVQGEQKTGTFYGGSNESVEDARAKVQAKLDRVKRKIAGDPRAFNGYEVDIREQVLEEINPQAVITRNRYGAKVLNVASMMILDIDKPKLSLSGLFSKKDDKSKMYEMVEKLASSKYSQFGFRIYETFQGVRVIVLGRDFDPRNAVTTAMMAEFNCDPLYTILCSKQECFRARLTPKPRRMGMKSMTIRFPREDTDLQTENWLSEYDRRSGDFSVCRFIGQAGAAAPTNDLVHLHDELTGASIGRQLA
ncbi:MAG TPA: hypothetical protein PLE39_01345 [Anaerolineales bacterium]|nr:hypothetical protein [Anaerolineales bacterium]HNO83477.1 hypothetical protein [Anaerolineales bacterium]